MEEFGRDACICGYHVYKEMWEAAAGELHSVQGLYAVAVKKRERSWDIYHGEGCQECVHSSCDEGGISCTMTGGRRYSVDLYTALTYYTVHKSARVILYH